jgi:dihydrofolate reductase
MAKLRVNNFSVSLDGYGAGTDQSTDDPLGVGFEQMHEWIFETRSGRQMIGETGGEEGVDEDFFVRGVAGVGATIMGRNMFGPVRGPWPDDEWRGWWGDTPPYHHSVFVLTHHARAPIEMKGGTTFHFVDTGIEDALEQAFAAAGGADVRLGGGVSTIQQYMRAGLLDELHLALVPILLGRGERLFDNVEGVADGYECTEFVCSPAVAHVVLTRTSR